SRAAAPFGRFPALASVTFAEFAERAQVPVELLMLIREAAGSAPPLPSDRMRDEELPYAEFIEVQIKAGFRPAAIQQLLRVQGDSLRRMADTEAAWWQSEMGLPAMEPGRRPEEIMGLDFGDQLSALAERALLGMYHLHQTQTWTGNIIQGFETMLSAAGLHSRLDHPPAMCFLDITGYSRLTEERGHTAAATLAPQLGRVGAGAAGPARAADVGHVRREAGEMVGRRGHALLPEPRAGRGGRARHGGRGGRGRAAARACRPARRASHLPGGRLLRRDGERRV